MGVLGGFYGAAFNKLNIKYCHFRKTSRLADYPLLEVCLMCVVTSLICFPNEYTKMPQSELIALLFKTCKFNRQSEDMCHYSMVENATSVPSYQDMIVGTVTPEMVSNFSYIL